MFDASDYRERAEMHEELAGSTADKLAERMHLAMAAEFRRRAEERIIADATRLAAA